MREPVIDTAGAAVYQGDCIEVMREIPSDSVDACVTDPPYNLSFMGAQWDTFPIRKRGQGGTGIHSEHAGGVEFKMSQANSHAFQVWCEQWATETLRILKPGGWMLAMGGTRTQHRLICAIEDAGFEIRDGIADFARGGDANRSPSGHLAWMYGSGFP